MLDLTLRRSGIPWASHGSMDIIGPGPDALGVWAGRWRTTLRSSTRSALALGERYLPTATHGRARALFSHARACECTNVGSRCPLCREARSSRRSALSAAPLWRTRGFCGRLCNSVT